MKKATWDNPNKMHIETGYKLFDEQTNLISYGNVFANTQASYFIRPWIETECNRKTFRPGELLKADLHMVFGNNMRGYNDLPWSMRRKLEDTSRTEQLILYKFRVWKRGQEYVIGWVLTDYDYNLLEVVATRGAHYFKRLNAVLEAAEYVSNSNA